jgi:phosphate transport system substrate-binding protein
MLTGRRVTAVKFNKWIGIAVVAGLALGALTLSGCGGKTSGGSGGSADASGSASGGSSSGAINIAGSDTMVNLAQAWAEKYMAANKGVQITVKGGGSGNGIAALLNKTVDFADSSREVKDEEIAQAAKVGVDPVTTPVAKDGVVIIVNSANKVSDISTDTIGKIYRGEITNWKDVLGGSDAPIVLLGRDSSSGTYSFIKDTVVGTTKEYSKSMRNLASTQAIADEVAKNPNAIGYIGLGYENKSIKALTVDGNTADIESVLNETYPLSRNLNMVSNGDPADAQKEYLDWILSDEGQAVVKEQGFVPLNATP